MFGPGTKYCGTVFGQNTSSRAEPELNPNATPAVTTVTNRSMASATMIRTQQRDIDPTRIRRNFSSNRNRTPPPCPAVLPRQAGSEWRDLVSPPFIRLAFPMKENVTADPIYVRFFGANGVMFDAQMPADAIKELGRRCSCSGGGRHAGIVSKLLRHGNSGTSAKSR
jgi:hypothetical protein